MNNSIAPTSQREVAEPIPAPTKEVQYRAIGLLGGRYVPRDEITQGILVTTDGTIIEAVVLGRLLGLLKARVDLEKEHLWVVYPRTRDDEPLHVQLCGIWEPETLHPDSPAPVLELKQDYFSIQGEVIFQNQEENWVVVKIHQKPRSEGEKPKYFKLKLSGSLPEKAVKKFWRLDVQREGNSLVIKKSATVADFGRKPKKKPPKKKSHRSSNAKQQPAQAASPKEPPKLKKTRAAKLAGEVFVPEMPDK